MLAATACQANNDAEVAGRVELQALPAIGAATGGGPDMFGRVADVELDEAGRVYVLDGLAREVRVFDAAGSFMFSFGRQGEGPGELGEPFALAWGPAGNLWVVDAGNARYSLFTRSGDFVTSYPRSPMLGAAPWPVPITEAGRIYDLGADLSPEGIIVVPFALEIVDGGIRELGAVALPEAARGGPPGIVRQAVTPDGGVVMELLEIPFLPRSWWQIGPQGDLWYTHTSSYDVRRRTGDGEEVVFSRPVEPAAVTAAERAVALESDDRIEPQDVPTLKPATRGFFVDDAGRLWVVRWSRAGENASMLDVFNPDGEFIGTVSAELVLEPRPKVRDAVLIGVARDELGIDRVVRYRIAL